MKVTVAVVGSWAKAPVRTSRVPCSQVPRLSGVILREIESHELASFSTISTCMAALCGEQQDEGEQKARSGCLGKDAP